MKPMSKTPFHIRAPVHHTGKWRIRKHFFGGSELILLDAAVMPPANPLDENPRTRLWRIVDVRPRAFWQSGTGRNEVADRAAA